MMEVIIVGSGTGLPSLRRGLPAMLVKMGKENILFDSGAGTLRKLLEVGVSYHDLDYLFYTHLHPDHTLDLVSILFAMKYPGSPRKKELHLIGPKGFRDFHQGLVEVYGHSIQAELYELYVEEIGEGEMRYNGWKVTSKSLPHTETSLGYRLESYDKRIAYSGDTDYCRNIVTLAKEVDLLILECSFPDEMKVEGHLTPSLAGRIARKAHCRRLILTHLYPLCDEYDILRQCRKEFAGEVIVAHDLLRVKI